MAAGGGELAGAGHAFPALLENGGGQAVLSRGYWELHPVPVDGRELQKPDNQRAEGANRSDGSVMAAPSTY